MSYNEKHNDANGENNQDGANDNNSWNGGAEGPPDDPEVNALRWQQKRNFITTLILSQGIPMLLAGDEISQTQQGNNNTYCQDNELTWLNWDLSAEQQEFCDFVRRVVQIRSTHPVFLRRKFFHGRAIHGADVHDLSWFDPSGQEMSDEAWNAGYVRCLGVRLVGDLLGDVDERGEPITDDSFLLLLNAHHEAIPFTLPVRYEGQVWECLLDTAAPQGEAATWPAGQPYELHGRSMVVLRSTPPPSEEDATSPATAAAQQPG